MLRKGWLKKKNQDLKDPNDNLQRPLLKATGQLLHLAKTQLAQKRDRFRVLNLRLTQAFQPTGAHLKEK